MTNSAIRYLVLGVVAATAIATSVTVAATPDAATVVEQGQGQAHRSEQGNANAQGPQLVCGTRDLDDQTADAVEDYTNGFSRSHPVGSSPRRASSRCTSM